MLQQESRSIVSLIMCVGVAAPIALKKNLMVSAVLSLISTTKETTMKLTTIALAIAFALPSTFALARGGMSIGSHVTRPFSTVGAAGTQRSGRAEIPGEVGRGESPPSVLQGHPGGSVNWASIMRCTAVAIGAVFIACVVIYVATHLMLLEL